MQKNKLYHFVPFIALIMIFMIDLIFIVSIHWQWNHTMKKYIPLQNEIQLLKSDISTAHLWLEEAIAGDKYVDIKKDVMIPFQHAAFNTYVENSSTVFDSKIDEFFLGELKDIDTKLTDFYHLAKERWEKSELHGIGSSLDQKFDKEFNTILTQIDMVSSQVNKKLSEELAQRNYNFAWIIGLFLLVNLIVFTMLYVSTRRQQLQQLLIHEEKERAVVTLRSIGDAVITTDIKGYITFFNDVAEKLTEYTMEEVQGQPIDSVLRLYNIKTGERVFTPISDVLDKGITKLISNGTKLVSKSGKEYILNDSAAPVLSEEGEILGTVLVFQNDTKRHEMEENIRQSEEKYRSLVENIRQHYFLYTHDIHGVFTYLSHSMTDVLGYTVEEFKSHYTTYHTDDPINENVEKFTEECISGKQHAPYDISIYHKNGDVRYLEVSESPVFNNKNEVISIEGVARDITQNYLDQLHLKEQKELLDYKAHYDTLTDLPNRQLFLDRLSMSIKKAQRLDEKVAVLFIDLDHFKEINDSLGHQTGDEVLKEVSTKLSEQIRDTDTLARLGGDEFILIIDRLHDTSIVVDIVEKMMDVMNDPLTIDNQQLYITLSIGITLYPDDGDVSENLLKNADAAMYKAKDDGRNTYCFYTEKMTEKAFERIMMETSLRQALKNEEFVVYYQPQFNGIDESIIGLEALIRWQHPTMGLVSPLSFITLAEETGFIVLMDQWMMRTAMSQMARWYEDGFTPGTLGLNVSMKQIRQPDFISIISSMIKETGCKSEWLVFEVPESQIMINPEHSIQVLQGLSDMGIKLAIDDFGTGYSSLSYLKRLPIDTIKIDKSFVKGLPEDREDAGIVRSLIILAKSLDLDIIAEGAETLEQKLFLLENGCQNIQGYFYAKPITVVDMEKMLQDI